MMGARSSHRRTSLLESGQRRRVVRVQSDLHVVIAYANGEKESARVVDVSVGGMHVACRRVPEYGESLTVVVQLDERADWALLPATVRWFTRSGFGLQFAMLTDVQARALAALVDRLAA